MGKNHMMELAAHSKNRINCLIHPSNTSGVNIPGPDSVYINNVKDAFDPLVYFFQLAIG